MASSPTRLARKPPPTTMRSVSRQALSLRKRRMTSASSCAEILDGALHDPGRVRIALGQQRVELLLADVLARLVAERVVAGLAQRLAPVLDDGAEGAFAGAVAQKTFVILQLDIVAVDIDGGQAGGAMRARRASVVVCSAMNASRDGQSDDNRERAESFTLRPDGHGGEATIPRTISIARRIRVIDASSVRKPAWASASRYPSVPADGPAPAARHGKHRARHGGCGRS